MLLRRHRAFPFYTSEPMEKFLAYRPLYAREVRAADVSTGHVTSVDGQILLKMDVIPNSDPRYPADGAARLFDISDFATFIAKVESDGGASSFMKDIFRKAHAEGFSHVIFDPDAPKTVGLPIFDW